MAARVYTNEPVNDTVSGLQQIVPSRWADIVIKRREVFVANSVEGVSDVVPDHALIAPQQDTIRRQGWPISTA